MARATTSMRLPMRIAAVAAAAFACTTCSTRARRDGAGIQDLPSDDIPPFMHFGSDRSDDRQARRTVVEMIAFVDHEAADLKLWVRPESLAVIDTHVALARRLLGRRPGNQ